MHLVVARFFINMQSASLTLRSVTSPSVRSLTFRDSRSLNVNKGRARIQVRAQGRVDAAGLAVLTQRIQRMQASQEESKWPGYQQWRESNESPWCGFGEWRTTDKSEDHRRSSILRHRMSKPGLAAEEDVVEAVDHLDRLEKLDVWHKTCWNNFRDSDAFGR